MPLERPARDPAEIGIVVDDEDPQAGHALDSATSGRLRRWRCGQGGKELDVREGLAHEPDGARKIRIVVVAGAGRVARHRQDPQLRMALPEATDERAPRHARHHHVGEDEVERRPFDRLQRLRSGRRGRDLEAAPLERPGERSPHRALVFHQQDPDARSVDVVVRHLGHAPGRRVRGARERDLERRALRRLREHADLGADRVGDRPYGRKPEPGALSRILGRHEGIEDAIAHLRIDSGTRIGNAENDAGPASVRMWLGVGLVAHGDPQHAAVRHRVASVEREIEDDLFEMRRIGEHPARFRWSGQLELHVRAQCPA